MSKLDELLTDLRKLEYESLNAQKNFEQMGIMLGYESGKRAAYEFAADRLEAILQEGVERPVKPKRAKWHRVERDELPSDDRSVLIRSPGFMAVAKYMGKTSGWHMSWNNDSVCNVTHWREEPKFKSERDE